MPKVRAGRQSLPSTTTPTAAPSPEQTDPDFHIQVPQRTRAATVTSGSRYNPYPDLKAVPTRYAPQFVPQPLPKTLTQHLQPLQYPRPADHSPNRQEVPALVDYLPLQPKEGFYATAVPCHIRLELAGALSATAAGIGDAFSPLLRLLVPEPYDEYGTPARRGVVPVTNSSALASDVARAQDVRRTLNPGEFQPRTSTKASTMAAAYSKIQSWGLSYFSARSAWVTSPESGLAIPRATVIVSQALDIAEMSTRLGASLMQASEHARLHAAERLIASERASRSRESVALAIGRALVLKQTIGHGYGIAIVGSRFSRVAALSDDIVAVELGATVPAAAFTVVNILSNVFDDRLYDRMPHMLSVVPDRAVASLIGASLSPSRVHYDNALDVLAMQRFLDLFAAAHSVAECGTPEASRPVYDAILRAAKRHPAPGYFFPTGTPRSDVAAVWALQLSKVVVAELPPSLFDRLLAEMSGAVISGSALDAEVVTEASDPGLPTPRPDAQSTSHPLPMSPYSRSTGHESSSQLGSSPLRPPVNQLHVDQTGHARVVTRAPRLTVDTGVTGSSIDTMTPVTRLEVDAMETPRRFPPATQLSPVTVTAPPPTPARPTPTPKSRRTRSERQESTTRSPTPQQSLPIAQLVHTLTVKSEQ